ncbi:FAR1-RELATED SEQUENCE 3 [Spatholobus suberectus]|nr:FAR1-RELATED SEQUENCE 3 [Spatholobus suberectus]
MEEGSDHQAMADDKNAKSSEGGVNNVENFDSYVEIGLFEPYKGMEFDSEDVAKTFNNEYARRLGFNCQVGPHGCSKVDEANMYKEFVCGRDDPKRKLIESCNAMIRIEQKGQNKWVLESRAVLTKEVTKAIWQQNACRAEPNSLGEFKGMMRASSRCHKQGSYYAMGKGAGIKITKSINVEGLGGNRKHE